MAVPMDIAMDGTHLVLTLPLDVNLKALVAVGNITREEAFSRQWLAFPTTATFIMDFRANQLGLNQGINQNAYDQLYQQFNVPLDQRPPVNYHCLNGLWLWPSLLFLKCKKPFFMRQPMITSYHKIS